MSESIQAATVSPEALLARYRAHGDPEALAGLFDATAQKLFRVALRIVGDAEVAEDALQETYLAVIQTAKGYDPARPAWPWLVGILQRKLVDARRRDRRVVDPLRLELRGLVPDPPTEAVRREQIAEVRKALDELPEPYRSVGLLR